MEFFYLSFFWDCFKCTNNDGYNYYVYIPHSLILLQRLHIYQVSLYFSLSVLLHDFPKEEYMLNNIYFFMRGAYDEIENTYKCIS